MYIYAKLWLNHIYKYLTYSVNTQEAINNCVFTSDPPY